MKVLLINGSPRRGRSNTLRIADAFVEGLSSASAIDLTRVEVASRDIKPCLGCFACWKETPGRCVIKDDMGAIIQALLEADVVLWSFPLYYYGLPSGLKAFVDRMLPMNLPFMEETADGTAAHPARHDKKDQKHVLVSSCGFWSHSNNYEALFAQFDLMFGKGNYERITCPEGELLSQAALSKYTTPWLDLVRQAGAELGAQGSTRPETRKALEALILPPKTFQALANASWGLDVPAGLEAGAPAAGGNATTNTTVGTTSPASTRSFIAQMAVLYNPAALEGKEALLEMAFSDTGECHRILLGHEEARLLAQDETVPGKLPLTRIETSFTTWAAISNGELDGAAALMDGRYRVLGNFDLMLKMDKLFAGPEPLNPVSTNSTPTSPAPRHKKADLFLVILPWLALWIGLPISPQTGTLASLGALAFLLFAGFVRRLSTHEQIAGALVALVALGNVAGIPATLLIPLSYLAFGAHWLLSCLATPLTAAYSKEGYGGDDALKNPLFVRTNLIITLVWGALYTATALWTWFLIRSPLAGWSGLINSLPPALCGLWTAWFQRWYPAHLAGGRGRKRS